MPEATHRTSDTSPVVLHQWGAFLLLLPTLKEPTIHLVGINQATQLARVSSAVISTNASRSHWITSSRIYRLAGPPSPAVFCISMLRTLTAGWRAALLADMTEFLLVDGVPTASSCGDTTHSQKPSTACRFAASVQHRALRRG